MIILKCFTIKKIYLKKSMEKAFKTKSVKFYFISKLVEKSETLINIHPKSILLLYLDLCFAQLLSVLG